MPRKGVYIVVSQDTIIQSREYIVFADSEFEARVKIGKGEFLSESSATTMDTLESKITKAERIA